MPTTALPSQPKVVECAALSRHFGIVGEIHDLRVRCATLLAAIGLDETLVLLPLTGDGKVAGIAADRNREIHASVLICEAQFVFRRLEQ